MPQLAEHIPINKQRTSCAEKNDKLGWKSGFAVEYYGMTLGVRTNNPDRLDHLRTMLPEGCKPTDVREVDVLLSFIEGKSAKRKGVKNFHIVYDAWSRIARTMDFDEALATFESGLRLRLATHCPERLFLTCPVVNWKGKAVFVLGQSGSGVSTLVEALTQAGGELFSQEFGLIDSEGMVCSFDEPTRRPIEPGLILLPRYEEGRQFRPARLSAGKAALELFVRVPSAQLNPARALGRLALLAGAAPAFRGRRGEADQVVRFVGRKL
ncbi:MAG: hypothetical protein KC910_17185 [Candidatus Eremiobacteraeota bacterium]|nr:hypothetical protein [Candidatus Eremiobacteraeota bacterium]